MHLAYLDQMKNVDLSLERRKFLKAGAAITIGGLAPSLAFGASKGPSGFKGTGRMGMSTGEDWIDTFFTGGADVIIDYYADNFVFEDLTFFQCIDNKEELYRAFLPFNNSGPDSPLGVHHFDIVRYDGGPAGDRTALIRNKKPDNYTDKEWEIWSKESKAGADYEYDEWAHMAWVWRAKHNSDDFLGLKGAKGKTTYVRGTTFHCYKNRKIVREFTQWNFREVAIQLGAFPQPDKFWLKK